MNNCVTPFPEKKSLEMKEWRVSKSTGLLKSTKYYQLIVTVDNNILLVELGENNDYHVVVDVLNLDKLKVEKLEERKDRSILDLVIVKQGLIFDSKNKNTVKFGNEDMADEFLHYLYNYKSTIIGMISK